MTGKGTTSTCESNGGLTLETDKDIKDARNALHDEGSVADLRL